MHCPNIINLSTLKKMSDVNILNKVKTVSNCLNLR